MGGCGPGTKRTPLNSCAIDPSAMSANYEWSWDHDADTRRRLRRSEAGHPNRDLEHDAADHSIDDVADLSVHDVADRHN